MKQPSLNINNNILNFEPSDDDLKQIEREVEKLLNEENK
jgi:hypothetical protein|tara:strand:- start:177 stop:293 length:117 start_codon:yes stop_codon:yes gene_type:complete